MGNANTKKYFTQQEIDLYMDLTYFNKKEVTLCFERFLELAPDEETRKAVLESKTEGRIEFRDMERFDEIRVNPFRDRILRVFSTCSDGSFSFDDFIDMMSVFSEGAPKSLKAEYAFRVFDFNEDDSIDDYDISQAIHRLTGEQHPLSQDDLDLFVDQVLNEADLNEDRRLSFPEFEHVILKAPDFERSFRIIL